MKLETPRFMIAAPSSGSGKTTVVCGILKALMNKGLDPAAFKSGPDYIDPMFHSEVIGAKSRNLDVFLLGGDKCRYLLQKNTKENDVAVLEAAMGFYDGIGKTEIASAYNLATETKTPVVLVINGKGAALSLAAMINGFKDFRPDSNIKGAIINNINPMSYMFFKEAVEKETGVKLLGYMPHMENCSFESRHLGLITADEIGNLQDIVKKLAIQAEKSIDLDGLLELAKCAEVVECKDYKADKIADVTIAIARDKAFCFYYQDALDLFKEMGAKIVEFSPTYGKEVPECDGVYLGGGYPELYAKELMNNHSMLKSVKDKLEDGVPCIAECGGFMYLLDHYDDKKEKYNWVGHIAGEVELTTKLKRFGYITIEAQKDGLLAKKGDKINAHEFHYSESNVNGSAFKAKKASGRGEWECVNMSDTLYAGYPHIHMFGNTNFAKNFIKACEKYSFKK